MNSCVIFPACANEDREGMTGELDRQKEECRIQYEQIVSLSAKLETTQDDLKKVSLFILNISISN